MRGINGTDDPYKQTRSRTRIIRKNMAMELVVWELITIGHNLQLPRFLSHS